MRDLDECAAEGEVEGVLGTADALKTPAQDAFEVVRRDQIGERPNGGGLYPGLDKSRDGGMDLVAAQLQRPWCQGPGTSIDRKWVADDAPR